MPSEGRQNAVKEESLWTDYAVIGGSGYLQTAGSVIILNGSGATADISASKLSATGNISGAAVVYGNQIIVAGSIKQGSFGVVNGNVGSPASVSTVLVQGGSTSTGAGSNVWVNFPYPYTQVPVVTATHGGSREAILAKSGSFNTGSFYVETLSASQPFSWVSFGKI